MFCETGAHESKTVDRPANMSIVKIGQFEVNLGRKLGEGGFGAVYRAKDTSQDPPAECAAKQVKYEKDAGQRAATEREAAFLRKVGAHNSIIGLFGLEIVDGHGARRAAQFRRNSGAIATLSDCLLYTSPSPRDRQKSRMPSSA